MATLLAGHRPPDLTRPFRLAWFGSSALFNPAVAAAVHPHSDVLAWDPDPTGIAGMRRLGEDAALANLGVYERPDPPPAAEGPFDVVVVDGVVDAFDEPRRAQVVAAATGLLRPGGVLCITYRTVVGWGEIVPIVRLLRHIVDRTSRDTTGSVADAMLLLETLRERGVGYLSTRPVVRDWVDGLLGTTVDDVISQYVRRDLQPVSHAAVADAVAAAGGVHIGSARLDGGLPETIPAPLAALVEAAPSSVLRQSMADLVLRRASRADLFTIGGVILSDRSFAEAVEALELTAFGSDPPWSGDPRAIGGEGAAIPSGVRSRLVGRVATAGEIWGAELESGGYRTLRTCLWTGAVHPVLMAGVTPAAIAASDRLTRVSNGSATPLAHRHVVAPSVGSAVPGSAPMDGRQRRFLTGRTEKAGR